MFVYYSPNVCLMFLKGLENYRAQLSIVGDPLYTDSGDYCTPMLASVDHHNCIIFIFLILSIIFLNQDLVSMCQL